MTIYGDRGGAPSRLAATLLFIAIGSLVEFWWFAVLYCLSAWAYCRHATVARLILWIGTTASLAMVNGNQGQSTLMTTIVSLDPIYCYVDVDEQVFQKYQRLARERPPSNLQVHSSRPSIIAWESRAFSFVILRRNADLALNGLADGETGRTSRATGRPRSVMTISWPFRTSSIKADRFWRASRMPASFMRILCYM